MHVIKISLVERPCPDRDGTEHTDASQHEVHHRRQNEKGDTVSKGSLVIERLRSSSHWRLSLASCNVAHRPNNATAFKQSCLQTAGFDRHRCLVSQRRMLPCCCCAVNFLRAPQRHCLLFLLCTFISVPVPSNARICYAIAAKLLPDLMLGQLRVVLKWRLKLYFSPPVFLVQK